MRPLLLAALLTGCTHSIHLVHVSDTTAGVTPKSGKLVQAESQQKAIMGFVSNTRYVDDARRRLMDQCKGGAIEGITTQFSTSHGFFSWTNKILMRGLCVTR